MCHGYEWDLLMAKAREEMERRKREQSGPKAQVPAATPAKPEPAPARNQEPVPV